MNPDSAQLKLDGDQLTYTPTIGNGWSFKLHDIVLIAEETTEAFGDDWFLWFVLKDVSHRAPIFTFGFNEVADELLNHFSFERPSLAGSTTFASRVLWPEQLAGVPFHEYTESHSITFWGRLLRSKVVESHYHPRVSAFLGFE